MNRLVMALLGSMSGGVEILGVLLALGLVAALRLGVQSAAPEEERERLSLINLDLVKRIKFFAL